jgi:4,5-dihydroxyphthalate decarboxylase
MSVPLSFACGNYDRTAPIREGDVRIEGVELTYLTLPVEETFFRMSRYREFHASEFSLSSYVASLRHERPFVAIPVFPSRMFRHGSVYVNTSAGITSPADLVSKRVGIAEWQLTANVWVRGILAEHYDVPVDSVVYRTGGLHEAGRVEKLPVSIPPTVDIRPIPAGATLADMLVRHEIDALYSPRPPRPFLDGHPEVARLFSSPSQEEAAYFERTGVFPIMHTLVLRREVYEEHRWLVRSMMKAFEEARRRAMETLQEATALSCMLPWLFEELQRTRGVLGRDYWPYGVEENRTTLTTFLRYAAEQGIGDIASVEDLFAPEAFEEVLV